jgi:hypothetical protein
MKEIREIIRDITLEEFLVIGIFFPVASLILICLTGVFM